MGLSRLIGRAGAALKHAPKNVIRDLVEGYSTENVKRGGDPVTAERIRKEAEKLRERIGKREGDISAMERTITRLETLLEEAVTRQEARAPKGEGK